MEWVEREEIEWVYEKIIRSIYRVILFEDWSERRRLIEDIGFEFVSLGE